MLESHQNHKNDFNNSTLFLSLSLSISGCFISKMFSNIKFFEYYSESTNCDLTEILQKLYLYEKPNNILCNACLCIPLYQHWYSVYDPIKLYV